MRLQEFDDPKGKFVEIFSKFMPLAVKIIGLKSLPKIVFEKEIENSNQPTFGKYVNDEHILHVGLANRHPNDILRTLAHELVHYKQDTEHQLDDESGNTGSPAENEANAIAGVVMRYFNKMYPEYLKSKPIIAESAGDRSDVPTGPGEQLIPFPQGTTMVDVSDVYDWYKLGMVISDLDDADPKMFGQGAPHTVIAFGSEEEESKLLPLLKRLGLSIHDIDRPEDVKQAIPAKMFAKDIAETIRKVGSQYRLVSKSGKNLGTYPSRSGAEKRERQVQYFKHIGESISDQILYHGGPAKISNFKIPAFGVYFSPHIGWAEEYGDEITQAKVKANNVYKIDYSNEIDDELVDALFDRDYDTVAKFIKLLQKQGYDAMQTVTDSEMLVVFPGTPIEVINDEQGKQIGERLNRTGSSELVIFDIDDTLLHTTAQIKVIKDGTPIRSLTNQEFNNYKLGPGEEFDFGEFRNAQKFEEESVPIGPMLDKLKQDLASGKNVVMLTARADFDNQKAVWRTFKRHGIDINKDVHLFRAGNLPGNESPAVKKAIHVSKWLGTGNYSKIVMYDDSEKNLTVFKSLEKKFPDVEFAAHHVSDEGSTRQVEEGWKDWIAGGALALGAAGAGAQTMPNINAQQVELANKYYNVLVQRAKEDGRTLDTRTLNVLKAKAQDAAAQKLQQTQPQKPSNFSSQGQQTQPQKSNNFPSQGSERKVAKDFDQFESNSVEERKKKKTRHAAYGPGPYGWYGYDAGYSGDSGGIEETAINELNTAQTLKFIKQAHGDQLYGNLPYWTHPRAVALTGRKIFGAKFNSNAVKTAFLHDVVEDTHISLDELSKLGFDPQVIEAVGLLTKDKSLTYQQNIAKIINSRNPLAMMVKYADNYENYTGDKSSWASEKAASSQKKYLASLNMLGDKLGVTYHIDENFADGRNPQDKGDSARHGIRKGMTIAQLKKVRSSDSASPRKKQLAHWQINMRQGRKK
jgi:hypothetical protein